MTAIIAKLPFNSGDICSNWLNDRGTFQKRAEGQRSRAASLEAPIIAQKCLGSPACVYKRRKVVEDSTIVLEEEADVCSVRLTITTSQHGSIVDGGFEEIA